MTDNPMAETEWVLVPREALSKFVHQYEQEFDPEAVEDARPKWIRDALLKPPHQQEGEVPDLVETIAHKEQIGIWANEIATAISLGDFLKEDWSFDDSVDLEREIVAQLRDVLSSAFSHPAYDIASALLSQASQIEALRKERDDYLVALSTSLGGVSRYVNEQGDYRSLEDWSAFLLERTEALRLSNHENRVRAEAAETKLAEAITLLLKERQARYASDVSPLENMKAIDAFLDANGGGQ